MSKVFYSDALSLYHHNHHRRPKSWGIIGAKLPPTKLSYSVCRRYQNHQLKYRPSNVS